MKKNGMVTFAAVAMTTLICGDLLAAPLTADIVIRGDQPGVAVS